MNEECSLLENQDDDASTPSDFAQTPNATSAECPSPEGEASLDRESAEAAIGIFADTGADSDFDCKDLDPTNQKNELDELRGELMQLREELNKNQEKLAQMQHIEKQYAEFAAIYPNTPIASLSQEVWRGVESGNTLAAAFALAEHRHQLSLQKASASNADNRARSAGAAKNAESVEFSPAEVRAMTATEVRANLSKIMRSMQKWH